MMDLRSQLTLVTPTLNRQMYLERFMEYYRDAPFQVWIVDGTETPYPKDIPEGIRYIHKPNLTYCQKLDEVFGEVTTPYSVLGAEDDFFALRSLEKALHFLDEHPDYGSVQGQWVKFRPNTSPMEVSTVHGRGNNFHANQDDVFARMETLYVQYTPIYYAVQRTEFFKDFFAATAGNIFNLNLVEMLLGLYNMIEGKSWVMPVFYGAREYIASSAGNKKPMVYCAFAPEEAEEFSRVLHIAATRWHQKQGLPYKQALKKVKKALHIYYSLVNDPNSKKVKAGRPLHERIAFYLTYRKYKSRYVRRYNGPKVFPFDDQAALEDWEHMKGLIKKHNIIS